MVQSPLDRLVAIRHDPMVFCRECVLTLDQVDLRTPVKRYPADLPYMAYIAEKLLSERLLIFRKSRRMKFTWYMSWFNLWDAMLHIGRAIFVGSSKEEKSDEIVRRSKFIYENIPAGALPIKPRMEYKYCRLSFPELDSTIVGVPQGSDQLRQPTASRIFCDEFAFWEKARESYAAMRPAIEGGGQIVIVSTSNPGFFRELVEDKIDQALVI